MVAAFDYQALNDSGKKVQGTLEADSLRHGRQLLRERGLSPLELSPASEKSGSHRTVPWRKPGLPVKQLALLTRQLATLIHAGLPLEESLRAVAQQTSQPRVASIVASVRARVMEGHSLASALDDFPRAFPRLYRATVAAGEQSGYLDRVMDKLADHTEEAQQFRQKIQMALIYPCLLMFIAVVMVGGLMVYVVPDVITVFVSSGQSLPALTVGLVAMSDFLVAWGWLLLLALVALGFAINRLLQRPALRLAWHRQLLHWPFIRRFSRGVNTANYASTLSILTGSGLPLVDAMQISSEVIANEHLKMRLQEACQQVKEGSSLHRSLDDTGYFPPMMLHMIASGEASGELDRMLERTAAYQSKELQNLVTVLVSLFEPLMLLVMGVAVLLIVMAILLPILNMNQLVG